MFDFLFVNKSETFISTFQEKEAFVNEFFEQVKEELPAAYVQAKDIHQSDNELVFNAPPFRHVWNGWNIFNPIIRGEFRFYVVANLLKLETRMNFKEFFFIALALSFASAPGFAVGAYGWAVAWLAGLWGIFYGGSRLIHSIRLRNKIKRLIRETEKIKKHPRDLKDVWEEDKAFINEVFIPAFFSKAEG